MAYLKECLVPKLKRGDVVMMDNLPVHRVAGGRIRVYVIGIRSSLAARSIATESRCPRWVRSSPDFRHDVAALRTTNGAKERHPSNYAGDGFIRPVITS